MKRKPNPEYCDFVYYINLNRMVSKMPNARLGDKAYHKSRKYLILNYFAFYFSLLNGSARITRVHVAHNDSSLIEWELDPNAIRNAAIKIQHKLIKKLFPLTHSLACDYVKIDINGRIKVTSRDLVRLD